MRAAALALAVVLGAAPAAADDAVAKAIAALGGQERWDAVESLVFRGTYALFSTPQPFVLYRERPGRYRFEHRLLDAEIVHGFDGEEAWWINTSIVSPVPWAVEPPAPVARTIAAEAEIGGPLVNLARGHRVEVTGEVDLEGERLWELVVTLANGGEERWYLEPETFLPVTRLSRAADGLEEKDQRADFYDYREVAGLRIPHRVEVELGYNFQVMEITDVEVDAELDGALFAMPLAAGMEALQGLTGRWRVTYESRPNPGVPWAETGEFETEIRGLYRGALLEEELAYPMFATPRRVKRWRSWDRFRGVYRITLFDSMTGHVDVLEGRLEDGRLTATDAGTDTAWEARGQRVHTREVTYDLAPDGFKVDLEASMDGGATWTPVVRFVYERVR